MRTGHVCTIAIAALASAACAAGTFKQVSFAGEASPEVDSAGRTVHVVRNSQMKDTVLEARIRNKLETFLLERGYILSSPDKAELYVMATFGSGPRVVGTTASVFREKEVRVQRSPSGQVTGRTFVPERMETLRVATVENSVWLMVLSSDARHYRETGQVKNLWRGESAMRSKPEEIGEVAPYLIVPAMRYFGKGTRQTLLIDVRQKDLPAM